MDRELIEAVASITNRFLANRQKPITEAIEEVSKTLAPLLASMIRARIVESLNAPNRDTAWREALIAACDEAYAFVTEGMEQMGHDYDRRLELAENLRKAINGEVDNVE